MVWAVAPAVVADCVRFIEVNCGPLPPSLAQGEASPFQIDVPSTWFVLPMNSPNGVETIERAPKFHSPSPKALRVTCHQYCPSQVPQTSKPNSGRSAGPTSGIALKPELASFVPMYIAPLWV